MAPAELSTPRPARRSTSSRALALTGSVTLALDGQLVSGLVLAPHAELGLFLFVPDDPDAYEGDVEEGAMVRIRQDSSAGFDAVAEILEVDDRERWILSVPVQLAPQLQRRSKRVLADGAWTLETEDGDSLDVFDVSARGIGIEFPAGDGPAGIGERVVGTLRAETVGDFEVRMECTNVRPHPDDDRLWIVGGRLVMSDRDAQVRYQSTLAVFGA